MCFIFCFAGSYLIFESLFHDRQTVTEKTLFSSVGNAEDAEATLSREKVNLSARKLPSVRKDPETHAGNDRNKNKAETAQSKEFGSAFGLQLEQINTSTNTNSHQIQKSVNTFSHSPKYSPIGPRRDIKVGSKESDIGKPSISEDDSMSISDSVSTINTTLFEPIEQKEQEGNRDQHKCYLRPPPGLAPPPGFTNNDKLQVQTDQQLTTESSSNPNMPLVYNPILSNLLLDQSEVDSPGNEIIALKEDPDIAGGDEVLLGVGEHFDVMNFFSFLDEGVHAESDAPNLPGENGNYTSVRYDSNNKSLHSNPWGGTQTPRGLAYGIEVETGSDKDVNRDDEGIQLLTPTMILGQDLNAGKYDEKDEGEKEDVIFDFSRLLDD